MGPKVWIGLSPDLFSALQPHAKKMGISGEAYAEFMLRRCVSALNAEKVHPLTTLPQPKVLDWRPK